MFPIWQPDKPKPVGAVLYRPTGAKIPTGWNSDAKKWERLEPTIVAAGSKAGLCGEIHRLKKFPNATVWLVEGSTDGLALIAAIPPAERDLHIVLWNPFGSEEIPPKWVPELLKGHPVRVVRDCDKGGQAGLAKWSKAIATEATTTPIVLPYDIKASHGADLRDFMNDPAGGWLPLLALAKSIKPIDKSEARPAIDFENYEETIIVDAEGVGQSVRIPFPMVKVIGNLQAITGDWPRRVGSELFVHDDLGISRLTNTPAMFGWAASATGRVGWRDGTGFVTKPELFAELQRTSTSYDAVEDLPRVPPLPNTYCTMKTPAAGDGKILEQLLDRFCPETSTDRSLMLAAIVTPMWGGPYGANPAFAITSPQGRGMGKTAFADAIARIYGGSIDLNPREDIAKVKERLLSSAAASVRIIRMDNVKSHKFSSPEFEGLITCPIISGRKLYVGEASRPNSMTWYLTMNGPSMSTDMAQRCVVISLAKPSRSGSWQDETNALIDENQTALIADIVGFFERSQQHFSAFTRWASWEDVILSRVPGHVEAQAAIEFRQEDSDAESEEGVIVEDYFRGQLQRFGYSPDTQQVFIPSAIVVNWHNKATNERMGSIPLGRMIKQHISEGQLKRLRVDLSRRHGRGLIWTPESIPTDSHVHRDLEQAITNTLQMEKERREGGTQGTDGTDAPLCSSQDF